MDSIVAYANCYLLHKSIVITLDLKYAHEMNKIIEHYGNYSIHDIMDNYNTYIYELNISMFEHYNNYFKIVYNCDISKICDEIHERLTSDIYCTIGVGHLIYSKTWKFPQHWCIKQEYYENVMLKDYEWLVLKIYGVDLRIDSIAGKMI